MGCCASQNADNLTKQYLCQRVKDAIDSCNSHKITLLYKNNDSGSSIANDLDQEIVTINSKKLNALAYCVHSGNTKMFKFLLSQGCSIGSMESLLSSQGMRAINMICFKNFTDLLQAYLPLYLQSSNPENLRFEHPIHSACRSGALGVLKFIQSYFSLKSVPNEFNIESVNENDENSALIACRYGQLNIVKYLHDVCRINLKVLNKKGENALLICLNGYKHTPSLGYFDLVVYLVEEIRIDLTYMYGEVVKATENKEIAVYLEGKLEKLGIFYKKNEVYDITLAEISCDSLEVNSLEDVLPFEQTNNVLKKSLSYKYDSTLSLISREFNKD
jgi:hypothetical protein